MAASNLTAERLRELLSYDAETGLFTRLVVVRPGRWKVGQVAGTPAAKPGGKRYLQINVDGHVYKAHRLAWLYAHGSWPENEVDHINGNGEDNRLCNLRDVGRNVNQQNSRKARSDSTTGIQGVHYMKSMKRWRPNLRHAGRRQPLGTYATPEEAYAVYLAAKRKLHEGCTI